MRHEIDHAPSLPPPTDANDVAPKSNGAVDVAKFASLSHGGQVNQIRRRGKKLRNVSPEVKPTVMGVKEVLGTVNPRAI
jgi:hypothetical protein